MKLSIKELEELIEEVDTETRYGVETVNYKAIALAIAKANEILGKIGSIKAEKILDYDKIIEPEDAQCNL